MADHTADSKTRQRHLYSAEAISRAKDHSTEPVALPHRSGIGVRRNGTYFLMVSLASLVGVIAIISMVGAKM